MIIPAEALGFSPGSTTSFREVSEAARSQGHSALGYRRSNGRLLLAPMQDEVWLFGEGDRVVLLADTEGGSL